MRELPPILAAMLTGFLSGLLLSIPVGPVNLTIINDGVQRGFRWAATIGLGASLMEVIYCGIAFTGLASFFSHGCVKAAMELISFVFLLFLGVKFLTAKVVMAHGAVEERIEGKFHPHSAFMKGFVRVLGNPGILLQWIILAANFTVREWVQPTHPCKFACCLGVALGTNGWFFSLAYLVSCRRRPFQERTLVRLGKGSGIGLLILGAVQGADIIVRLARLLP